MTEKKDSLLNIYTYTCASIAYDYVNLPRHYQKNYVINIEIITDITDNYN